MDFVTIFIGLMLVFTGAAFIGFPLGRIYGGREVRDKVAAAADYGSIPVVVQAARSRIERREVLNAEFLEESEEWDSVVFTRESPKSE